MAGTDLDRRELLKLAGAGAGVAALGGSGLAAAEELLGEARAGHPGPRALRALRREVSGRVLAPADAGYADARLLYNERFDGVMPAAVVQAEGVRDVKATVAWAARRGIPVTARCGGHSYAGYSTKRNGVVIDLRKLQRLKVDSGSGTAVVGAGMPLASMYTRLAAKGMTVPGGTCPTVGISGLALGGGEGMASRKLGLTSDNIRSMGIVLADGRYREVDRRRRPDLLWACRGGGGGNFGIVTHFEFDAYPVSTASYFHARWPWEQADEVLAAWQELGPGAPPELASGISLFTSKEGPKIGGKGQYFGSEADLRNLVAPLEAVDGAEITYGTEPYGELMLRWAGCEGETGPECIAGAGRARFYASSDYVADPLSSEGRARMMRVIEAAPHEKHAASLILDAYGGAINEVAPDATAFVHRDQLFSIQYFTEFTPGNRRTATAWVQDSRRTMRPDVSGQSYQNYIDARQKRWKRAYYGQNWERLREVKTAYDPEGVFRFRQGIPPKS
ncbi:MAG TPA: FAD-binding oxidoreductase [Solirubrobacterales bacterium]|nr:FAD-binding oxidoreductase [Solirubrobacterales bacterium]